MDDGMLRRPVLGNLELAAKHLGRAERVAILTSNGAKHAALVREPLQVI